jgi:hypothetical protein
VSGVSRTCPLFQASELCPGGFFNFTKMSGFLTFVDSQIQFVGGRYVRHSLSFPWAKFQLRNLFSQSLPGNVPSKLRGCAAA